MEFITYLIDFILNIDVHLGELISNYGAETYLILFIIIFCETGLVIMPFLPGDSLIFAAATFAEFGSLNIFILFFIILIAAILGDTVNYHIGKYFSNKLYKLDNNRFIKKKHIETTQHFFEKHGGKSIVLARFVPIVRTFAPFVAGIGNMSYKRFLSYNIIGAISWVSLFIFVGYFFGNIPFVKDNFSVVIIAIIFLSILPA
ncbi:MAG: DedA family protein, partial [Bacilli bacterium]